MLFQSAHNTKTCVYQEAARKDQGIEAKLLFFKFHSFCVCTEVMSIIIMSRVMVKRKSMSLPVIVIGGRSECESGQIS